MSLIAAVHGCDETTSPEGAVVASVTVTPADSTIDIGESLQLAATVRDRGGTVLDRPVQWASSDQRVATVSSLGRVTPHGPGSTTITAEASGRAGSASVVVVERAVATLVLTPASDTVPLGRTLQLEATLRDAQGRQLRNRYLVWASDERAVATVSQGGLVTGVANGAATITATHGERLATAEIRVRFKLSTVSANGSHSCGIDDSGIAYCWGLNSSGQLGVGAAEGPDRCDGFFGRPCSLTPRPVETTQEFVSIAAGGLHSCALTRDGGAYCWGSNLLGQLGDGSTGDRLRPVPVVTPAEVKTELGFASITAGALHTCALTSSGAAYCWGNNDRGELGTGGGPTAVVPTPVGGGLRFVTLDAGGYTTCGVTLGGDAYCWGSGSAGQLGTGPPSMLEECVSRQGPVPCARTPLSVPGGTGLSEISVGGLHVCARAGDGTAHCWGQNATGALGDGSTLDRHTPVPVSGGLAFTSIEAGGSNSCGLVGGGMAYCWGSNTAGSLGQGSSQGPEMCGPLPCSTVPIRVSGGLSFSILSGAGATCGLATDERAYCWGYNSLGQLGVGSSDSKAEPTLVFGQ